MKALEAVQCEYEDKKAEIVRKLAELAQQSEGIEEKKRRVRQEEKEADLEENRLVQLRSANAVEAEQLLKKQDSELKMNIAEEEGNLERLKKYCCTHTQAYICKPLTISFNIGLKVN